MDGNRIELGDSDLAIFALAICTLYPLDDVELQAAYTIMRPRELQRGEYLLRAGAVVTPVP